MAVNTERRTHSRKRPLSLVYVELPPSNGGMMRDLSEHGFALRAMMPLEASAKVPFVFALDNGVRIDGEAIVVRVADHGHVAALEFAGLAAHSRDQIRRWLQKLDEPLAREPASSETPAAAETTLDKLREEARTVAPRPSATPSVREASPPLVSSQPTPAVPPQIEQALEPEPLAPAPAPVRTSAVESQEPPPLLKLSSVRPTRPVEHEIAPPTAAPPPAPPQMEPEQQAEPSLPPSPPPVAAETLVPQQELPQPPPLLGLSSVRPGTSTVPKIPQPPPVQPLSPAQQTELAQRPEPLTPPQPPAPHPPPTPQLQQSLNAPSPLKHFWARPAPPAEVSAESTSSPASPARAQVPLSEVLIPPPSQAALQTPPPFAAPTCAPRRPPPPALEPLSSLEAGTDSNSPGWVERFTLGRAIRIMTYLALLVGAYVYHREVGYGLIWLGEQLAGDESLESPQPPRPSAPAVVPGGTDSSPNTESSKPLNSTSPAATPAENKNAEPPPAEDSPAAPKKDAKSSAPVPPATETNRAPTAASPSPAASSSDKGQQEYQQATEILHAPNRKAEIPEAVRLLWAAVKKGNVGAEITLAELYHHGRGVAKSCAQARILLSAAAQKGSRDAQARLKEFRRAGCRD